MLHGSTGEGAIPLLDGEWRFGSIDLSIRNQTLHQFEFKLDSIDDIAVRNSERGYVMSSGECELQFVFGDHQDGGLRIYQRGYCGFPATQWKYDGKFLPVEGASY
jgi:hypothetical protein